MLDNVTFHPGLPPVGEKGGGEVAKRGGGKGGAKGVKGKPRGGEDRKGGTISWWALGGGEVGDLRG